MLFIIVEQLRTGATKSLGLSDFRKLQEIP